MASQPIYIYIFRNVQNSKGRPPVADPAPAPPPVAAAPAIAGLVPPVAAQAAQGFAAIASKAAGWTWLAQPQQLPPQTPARRVRPRGATEPGAPKPGTHRTRAPKNKALTSSMAKWGYLGRMDYKNILDLWGNDFNEIVNDNYDTDVCLTVLICSKLIFMS